MAAMTFITAYAYRFNYSFNNTPIAEAIIHISKDHPDINIFFIYKDLDNYHTSAKVNTNDTHEALRQTIGLNPVSVIKKGNNYYVEALQHGKFIYRGRAIGSDGEPVAGATVMLLATKDSTVVTYGVADAEGHFSIPCDRSGVIAKLSSMGYHTVYNRCYDFNIGELIMPVKTTTLQQVSVTAQTASAYTDKTVYIPSSRQKNASQNAIDLLQQMAIPQIRINPTDESVSDNFGGSVAIFINYMEASPEEMSGMRTRDVKSVEYLEFPTDPRFHGQKKVINFIVQEYAYGGYTKLTANERLLTGLQSNVNLFSKFTYKRMTYDMYVGANNLDNNHNGNSNQSVYSLLKDGKPLIVNRNQTLEDSKLKENKYPVTFRTSYNTEKIQIRNSFGFQHLSSPQDYQRGLLDYRPEMADNYTFERTNPHRSNSGSYYGTFYFYLPRGFSFDVMPRFSYTHTNDFIEYSASNSTPILRYAKEDAYNFRVNSYLRKTIGNLHSLMAGIEGGEWSNNLHYTGTNTYHDKFSNSFIAGKLGYNLQTQKIAVRFDAGVIWEFNDINSYKTVDWYPFTHINVRYSLNNKNIVSAYFQYANNSGGITQHASDILKNNELMYISGNPDLKNSRHTTVNIGYTWLPSNAFNISAYGNFFGMYNRMFQTYTHYNDGQALISNWINDGDYINGSLGVAFNWKLLNGSLQLYANPEINFHKITGTCPLHYNPFTFTAQAIYYLNRLYFQAYYTTPNKGLDNETNTIYRSRNYYGLTVGWSNSDWNLRLSAYNFFNKGWKSSTLYCKTPLFSQNLVNYTPSYHSFISISATYTFGYGKKVQRGNEIGEQQGASSAIIK